MQPATLHVSEPDYPRRLARYGRIVLVDLREDDAASVEDAMEQPRRLSDSVIRQQGEVLILELISKMLAGAPRRENRPARHPPPLENPGDFLGRWTRAGQSSRSRNCSTALLR